MEEINQNLETDETLQPEVVDESVNKENEEPAMVEDNQEESDQAEGEELAESENEEPAMVEENQEESDQAESEELAESESEELAIVEENQEESDQAESEELAESESEELAIVEDNQEESDQAEGEELAESEELEIVESENSLELPELESENESEEIKIIAEAEESYVAPEKAEEIVAKTPVLDDYPASYSRIKPSRSIKPDDVGELFETVDDDEDYIPKSKKKKRKKKKKAKPVDKTVLPVKTFKLLICEIFVSIPIIGFIVALIISLNKKANKNLRSYSKLALFWHIVGFGLCYLIYIYGGWGAFISWIFDVFEIGGIIF